MIDADQIEVYEASDEEGNGEKDKLRKKTFHEHEQDDEIVHSLANISATSKLKQINNPNNKTTSTLNSCSNLIQSPTTTHYNHSNTSSSSSPRSLSFASQSSSSRFSLRFHFNNLHNRVIKKRIRNNGTSNNAASTSIDYSNLAVNSNNLNMNEILSCDQQLLVHSPNLTNATLINNSSVMQEVDLPHQNANNADTISLNSFNSAICLVPVTESIVVRGDGNITVFGVFNSFSKEFPSKLAAKLAPEEYRDTIEHVNKILKKELSNSVKWLIFGSICCCCTLGCSLLPVVYLNKKAKLAIKKFLNGENESIYRKLGIKWRLSKQKCNSNSLLEYVLIIDIMPVLPLYQPD